MGQASSAAMPACCAIDEAHLQRAGGVGGRVRVCLCLCLCSCVCRGVH